ncbi:hypothetical protein [Kineococcus aurantiacus]|uniref:Uncharacterized protein n=1 Tax=Kineococcus aurantiacus TaxID=37633 RepID=A0A7Y9J2G6_9ACTN|nr:hypothetical protein [Kineococcus aurantiacus]NYD24038.1 hypothetical protein [Kineococcus aurantiacus]
MSYVEEQLLRERALSLHRDAARVRAARALRARRRAEVAARRALVLAARAERAEQVVERELLGV